MTRVFFDVGVRLRRCACLYSAGGGRAGGRPGKLQGGEVLRCRLDRHHGHHGDHLAHPGRPRLRAEDPGPVRAGDLHVDEEQGHRRLPRQLDADHGGGPQALCRGQVRRRHRALNLEGAKYTLAVPKYLYDQGLKSFADIAKFKGKLAGKIYGIEPGNDGNRLIIDMIKADKFGLQKFQIVEFERAGHAGPGRARVAAQGADRLPRLGAAPDEHQIRDQISRGRRRCLRAQPRRRHDLHQHPRRLHQPSARTPAR